jgi:hypothetical protein
VLTYLVALAMVALWTFLVVSFWILPDFLVTIVLIVGLVSALVIDWFALGAINTWLTKSIWHTELRHDWKHLLVHGLALTVVFAFASIPILVMYLYLSIIPIVFVAPIVMAGFIVYCFVYGALARRVAFTWENKGTQPSTPEMRERKRYSTLLNV